MDIEVDKAIEWKNAVLRRFAYERDAVGMVTNVTRENGTRLAYAYNGVDRLVSEKEIVGGVVVRQAAYTYDVDGNRLTKKTPQATVSYTYPYGSSGNRLASWTAGVTNGPGGLVAARVAGGSSESIGTHWALGSLWVSNTVAQAPQVSGTNFWVQSLPLGEGTQTVVAAVGDLAGNVGFGAVTVAVEVARSGTYEYTAAGCVSNIVYSAGVQKLRYGLAWDGEYRLKSVATNGVVAESYGYDGLGRRVFIERGGVKTWLVYDGVHVIAETDNSGNLLKSYTYGPGVDNLLAMTVHSGAQADTYYALTDHLGTVHSLADEDGEIVESYEFDAWGRVLGVYDGSGAQLSESALGNRYLWQGREYSWKTGLYYFRARWYDPITGRWLSNDPIGISGGLNQYVFCANNPVNSVDPFGLWNFWNVATWGVGNGVGWNWYDSFNPFHESYGWGGAWEGAKGGAAAWADGVIPFWDPFQDVYADECGNVSGDYKASQFFGGISRDALLVAAGSGLASRYSSSLANSQRFGKGSQLFGRGGRFGAKGVFNQGPVRTGWGWNGTRDVFRTSWSTPGNRTYWNHLDWF